MKRLAALALAGFLLSPPVVAQGIAGLGGQSLSGGVAFPAGVDFTAGQTLYAQTSASLQFAAPFSVSVWFQGAMGVGTNVSTKLVANEPTSFLAGFGIENYTGFDFPLAFALRSTSSPNGHTCSNTYPCTRSLFVTDGNRHLLTTTFDGTTAQFYVDGVVRDQVVTGIPYTPGSNFWQVGQASGAFVLYDLRVYTRALVLSEVGALYAFGQNGQIPNTGGLSAGMAGHWLLNACAPSCPDTSGNGNTLQYDTAPAVTVTVPSAGAVLTGVATLTATATDVIAVSSVTFILDGSNVGAPITTAPYTTTIDTSNLTDGPHTITAIASNVGGGSTTSGAVNVTSSNGVTVKNYYFSAAGSDAADCLTTGTACQTIAKADSLVYHEGDVRHWRGGDTFTGCLHINGPSSGQVPVNYYGRRSAGMTDTSYGTGHAVITPNCTAGSGKVGAVNWNAADGWVWDGVDITGDTPGAAGRCISFKSGDFSVPHGTITIQNSVFHTCHDGLDNDFGAYLFFDQSANNGSRMIDHITLLNNTGSGASGPTSVDENFMDGYSYGCSVQFDAIQGNLVFNIGGKATGIGGSEGNGIVFVGACVGTSGASAGGISQFNVIHNNGANLNKCGSFYSSWSYKSSQTIHRMNESYDNTQIGGCDGGSWDLDDGVVDSLIERNYSHNNWGPCVIYFGSATRNTVRWNICDGDAWGIGGVIGYANFSGGGLTYTYNNVFVQNTSLNYAVSGSGCSGAGSIFANNIVATENQGRFQNNMIFLQTTNGQPCTLGAGGLTIKNNEWWGTFAGFNYWCRNGAATSTTTYAACAAIIGETGGIGADPLWVSPYGQTTIGNSTAGPNATGPNGFKLQAGSPAKAPAGSTLTGLPSLYSGQGTLDYFGVALPCPATGYPRGASC